MLRNRVAAVIASVASVMALSEIGAAPADGKTQRGAPDLPALMQKMTLEEKVGQLGQVFYFGAKPTDKLVREGQVGSLLFTADPAQIERLQRIAVEESRLGIPLIFGFDVVHGLRTIFPVPLALAASWDPALMENVQGIAAAEARAVGIHWTFAPMVDISRDPRWGRIVEGPGEDPFLASVFARAQVRGFQGGSEVQPNRVIAGVKHFVGYGAAVGGRDYDEVNLSDSELWNVYLPPFKAAIDAGAGNVMSAYMGLNGVPATGNRWLLTEVLRDTWGFKGFVVSDASAVRNLTTHRFARDAQDAAVRALTAGVDMEMDLSKPVMGKLVDAVNQGQVPMQTLDAAVHRVLDAKRKLGLFEQPYADVKKATKILATPQHREQARIAAERSAVLLRNEGGLLPLDAKSVRSIAVIGPLAHAQRDTLGSWVFDADVTETVTIAAGIRKKAGTRIRVDVEPGLQMIPRKHPSPFAATEKTPKPAVWSQAEQTSHYENALKVAKAADVIVAVLGQGQDMSGEVASSSTLALPGDQQKLLETISTFGKPVVLVLMNGRPLDLTWAAQHVPAILEVWHPGTQGGAATANLLFGDAVPGGKLPITWPRNVGQVPLFYARATSQEPRNADKRYWNEEGAPLFPFGFGLSYTTFSISAPRLQAEEIQMGEPVRVSVDVKNTGARAGEEVVQLYTHQRSGRALRPVRELKGFERVRLAPGESRTISFEVPAESLKYWSSADRTWVQDASMFDLWVGSDSQTTNKAQFRVVAR